MTDVKDHHAAKEAAQIILFLGQESSEKLGTAGIMLRGNGYLNLTGISCLFLQQTEK